MPKGLLTTLLLLALQTPAQTTLPPNYNTILENQSFRVIRVHYGPHEKVPVHDHPDTPTVYVYLNNSGPVRITHEEKDGSQSSLVRPPTHAGAFRVSPGMLERHSIENLSDLPSDFLRVELLRVRLGDKTLEFRGPAPADLTHNLTATEFSSPNLSVARTICVDQQSCTIAPSSRPSVIIGISESTVTTNGKKITLAQGEVVAIDPNQSIQISAFTSVAAHILQVIVQAP
jgi:quercetin dioxygenase-like cupin family protein